VKDDPRRLKTVLEAALRNSDMVLLSGGVSMGDADHTPAVLKALKVKNIFHKSAIRPGKPLWFGIRGETAVFGLPGNPVSVGATFHEFAFPALRKMAGMAGPGVRAVFLPLASPAKKEHPLREFRVARLEKGGAAVAPVESYRGSGDFVSAALSDGVIVIPEDRREMPAGEIVEFHPWDMA
jgi:molybdopterin molybdotransferase